MDQIPTVLHEAEPTPAATWLQRLRSRIIRGALWQNQDFMRLWTAQTISQVGSKLSREALPYTAILLLGATPIQMGLLGAAGTAPVLVIGLLVGVWVDRLRRRPLMIAADLGRALLLLSIPIAALFSVLRIEQLYVVALLVGCLSVVFDAAYQSFLPSVVERKDLVEGNSKLGMSDSVSEVVGPPLGGLLVQVLNGPLVVLMDALSFLWSALWVRRINAVEAQPVDHGTHPAQIWAELREGVSVLWQHKILRWLAITSGISNFFGWFFGAVYTLYAIRTLGFSPALLGITIATGGIGAFAGALLVTPMTRRFGVGPTLVGALCVNVVSAFLTWLAGDMLSFAFVLMVGSQIVGDAATTIGGINETSLRQTVTPHHLLGRVTAGMHALGPGIGTLGMLAGGVLGDVIGLQATVALIVVGRLLAAALLLVSPVRHARTLE